MKDSNVTDDDCNLFFGDTNIDTISKKRNEGNESNSDQSKYNNVLNFLVGH